MKSRILFLVIAGIMTVVGCSKQNETPAPATPSATQQPDVQQQAQAVSDQATVVADQAKTAADQVTQTADQAKASAQTAANNVSEQIQTLLAQAKALVDSGKFDDAIAQAKQVLNLDPNNADAKGIIETAKEKITALAQQKIADVKQGLSDKFGALTK